MNFLSTFVMIFSIFFCTKFDSAFGNEKTIDESLAGFISIGDDSRDYPSTEEAVNKEFCSNFMDRNNDFIHHIDEKHPSDFKLQILARLIKTETVGLLSRMCKNFKTRDALARILSDLNNHKKELKVLRDNHIKVLIAATQPNTTIDMANLLCFNDKLVDQIMAAVKTQETIKFLKKIMINFNKLIKNYLKKYDRRLKAVESCDYSTVPKYESNYKSLQMLTLEAAANLMSKAYGNESTPEFRDSRERSRAPTLEQDSTVSTLEPTSTEDKSEKAIDENLARFNRIGDESRPYPTTEESLNQEFCSVYEDRNVAFLDYIDEKFPYDYEMQILARIIKIDAIQQFHNFCKNNQSRALFRRIATDLNNHVKQLKVIRDKHINVLTEAARPNSTIDMAELLCFWDKFVEESIEAITAPETKSYLDKGFNSYGNLIKSALKKHNKSVKTANDCDYSIIPKQEPKFHSLQLNLIYATANVIKNVN